MGRACLPGGETCSVVCCTFLEARIGKPAGKLVWFKAEILSIEVNRIPCHFSLPLVHDGKDNHHPWNSQSWDLPWISFTHSLSPFPPLFSLSISSFIYPVGYLPHSHTLLVPKWFNYRSWFSSVKHLPGVNIEIAILSGPFHQIFCWGTHRILGMGPHGESL